MISFHVAFPCPTLIQKQGDEGILIQFMKLIIFYSGNWAQSKRRVGFSGSIMLPDSMESWRPAVAYIGLHIHIRFLKKKTAYASPATHARLQKQNWSELPDTQSTVPSSGISLPSGVWWLDERTGRENRRKEVDILDGTVGYSSIFKYRPMEFHTVGYT